MSSLKKDDSLFFKNKKDYLKVVSLGLGLSLGIWLMGFVILGEYFMGLNGNRELWKQPLHVSLRTILSNVGVGSSMLVVLLGTSHDFAVKKKISQIRN